MKHYHSLFLVAMLVLGAVVSSRPALGAEGGGGGGGGRGGGVFALLGAPPENIPGDRMGPISGFRRMGGNHYQLPDHGKSARQYSAGFGSGTPIPRRAAG